MKYQYDNGEDRSSTGRAITYGWTYGTGYGYGPPRTVAARKALQPLLAQVRMYDALRLKLENEGGEISDVAGVTEILSRPFVLEGNCRDCKVALTDQVALRSALYDIGNGDIHMDVRQLPTGMPSYYLCRVRHDYWSEYSLIVEDLYRSVGHPVQDERFVRLMDGGHETYYLRLSQFRDKVRAERDAAGDPSDWAVDDVLYQVGRHVLSAAWHEDQRPGVLTAVHFGLPCFRQAVETLYLCLCGELCELRGATSGDILAFFEKIYPQPGIHSFLRMLSGLDGAAINDLPRRALKAYARLSSAFGRFLGVEVKWGHAQVTTPLYKIVFANFSRLDAVAGTLKRAREVQDAVERLEQDSEAIVREIAE